MANLKVVLEIDNQGYIRGIKAAETANDSFTKSAVDGSNAAGLGFGKLGQTTDKLVIGMTKLKAVLVGGAMAAFARSAVTAADAVADLSKATDLSIGRILELQQALQASGGEGQNAAKLITEFYKSIEEAASGSDKTQENFAKLGVSLNDLGKLNTADLMDKTIKGFDRITDPAQRTALAIQLFGKSMAGVSPGELAAKMDELRGKFNEQEQAVARAADLNDRYGEAVNNLKLAFLTVAEPIIRFINDISKSKQELETMISVLKALGVVIAAVFGLTLFGRAATIIGSIGRGLAAIPTMLQRLATTGAVSFGVNSAFMVALRGVAKLVGFIAGGVGAALGLGVIGGGPEAQPGDQSDAETARLARQNEAAKPAVGRPVEAGKELTSQLSAVKQLADGYRRTAQASMDRLTTEVELLGKSKEEQETVKATAEINKRYADQTAALEQKKAGAKGATLALINKEIANLEDLRTSELDVYNITREQTIQYARQQQEVKNIVDLMEQMAQYQAEIAGFQTQQDAARTSAFEQVRAQQEAFELISQREQLEKSIQNLRGSDQDSIKKLFDLEQQRKTQLEAIQKIQNLPFEGVGGMKQRLQEINDLYDARRAKIEETAASTKIEQDSFSEGWSNAFEKFRNNIKTDAEYASQQFSNFAKGFEDAIVKFVQTGKLSFKDLANSIIAEFAKIQAQKMFVSLFDPTGGILSSVFGGLFGKAGGGPVMAGKPYMVGEGGKEIFVPNTAGSIVPNNQLGGGGQTMVTYNIQAVDASSFRSMVARDPSFIYAVTEQGRRSQPTRSR